MAPSIFAREDIDLIVEFAGCSLDEKPGSNWVQSAGGLPEYICRIARAVKRTGKSTSQAIAIAVSRVKKWAAGGDDVDADTRAKAAKALAEWEKLKAKGGKKKDHALAASHTDTDVLYLANSRSFNVDMVRSAWEERQRAARDAYFAANPSGKYRDAPAYSYVKELWTDFLIVAPDYSKKNTLFKVAYSVDAKQNVTFSDPVEVKTQYVVVKDGDLTGDDITDAELHRLTAAVGPCTSAVDTVLLSVTSRPSAVEQILALHAKG